jgi:hypothetical protein
VQPFHADRAQEQEAILRVLIEIATKLPPKRAGVRRLTGVLRVLRIA